MEFWKKLSLKRRVIACFTVSALLVCLIALVGLISNRKVVQQFRLIATKSLPASVEAASLRGTGKDLRAYVFRMGFSDASSEELSKINEKIEELIKNYSNHTREYGALVFVKNEGELFAAVTSAWDKWVADIRKAASARMRGTQEGLNEYLSLSRQELRDDANLFMDAVNDLVAFQSQEARLNREAAERTSFIAMMVLVVTLPLGMILVFGLGLLFASSLGKTLSGLAKQLSKGAVEVAGASGEISRASEALSSAATEQAAALQETAASIEEMSAMVAKNSENAKQSEDISHQSYDSAQRGSDVVMEMTTAIREISTSNRAIMDQVNSSNHQIEEIVKVIAEIGNKTKVINDIVFQTKLLSFNASVEAARAGEHGKGFAVVAEEVGNLAEMSGKASKEIATMLSSSINQVQEIVKDSRSKIETLINEGVKKVTTGEKVAQECSDVLNIIVQGVASVSAMASEIASASSEQANGVGEINKAMTQLDQVTHQNAATSGQTASAASQLSAQAESLKSFVDQLLAIIEGEGRVPQSATTFKRKENTKPVVTPKFVRFGSDPDSQSNVVQIESREKAN